MKYKRYILIALTILAVALTCFSLPISDLKSVIPADMYVEYYRRERISMVGINLLFLIIICQNLIYEKPEYSFKKKASIIVVLVLLDILVLWI
ncbi:MAG: hypothetical protein QM657_04040 [Lacrimispora sp.]|uniref:hypothetical protein n=1 Tax=Lacrimispora sp. TaxID=2719234 RepID=UPI0039E57757